MVFYQIIIIIVLVLWSICNFQIKGLSKKEATSQGKEYIKRLNLEPKQNVITDKLSGKFILLTNDVRQSFILLTNIYRVTRLSIFQNRSYYRWHEKKSQSRNFPRGRLNCSYAG